MKVLTPGHLYALENFENTGSHQRLQFIEKRHDDSASPVLVTVNDGTTNEEVLKMLIDRMKFLNLTVPSRENALAITKLEEALMWLEKRTADPQCRRNPREMKIQEYVLGFMFSDDFTKVALIRKTKPAPQAGLLNGIGGKIEAGKEDEHMAMVREFLEETGFKQFNWRKFCVFGSETFRVHCFMSYGPTDKLRTTTEEEVIVVDLHELLHTEKYAKMRNLRWLIPQALDPEIEMSSVLFKS